jgi:hypothetical protein
LHVPPFVPEDSKKTELDGYYDPGSGAPALPGKNSHHIALTTSIDSGFVSQMVHAPNIFEDWASDKRNRLKKKKRKILDIAGETNINARNAGGK